MHLRKANKDDAEFIAGVAEELHGSFKAVAFDKETTLDNIDHFIHADDNEAMILVAEDDDGIRGVICFMLTLTPFSLEKVACEPLFWTDGSRGSFKLLNKAYTIWAEKVGADVTLVSAPPTRNFEKWERLYKKMGYDTLEHTFIRKVV